MSASLLCRCFGVNVLSCIWTSCSEEERVRKATSQDRRKRTLSSALWAPRTSPEPEIFRTVTSAEAVAEAARVTGNSVPPVLNAERMTELLIVDERVLPTRFIWDAEVEIETTSSFTITRVIDEVDAALEDNILLTSFNWDAEVD